MAEAISEGEGHLEWIVEGGEDECKSWAQAQLHLQGLISSY